MMSKVLHARFLGVCCAILVLGLMGGPPARADESWLRNPGFDTDTFGWRPSYGFPGSQIYLYIEWSDEDVDASPASGSGLVVNESQAARASWVIDTNLDCYVVDPAARYDVGAWIRMPTGQSTTGSAEVHLLWYTSGVCTGVPTASRSWALRTPSDDYTWVSSTDLAPPPTASSARVGLAVFKDQEEGRYEVHFDEVLFVPEPSQGVLHGSVLFALIALGRAARPGRRGAR